MRKALIQMNAAVLLWGFTGVLGRAITLSAPVLVWWRLLMTALILAFIITVRKQWIFVAKNDFKKMVLAGILIGIHWVAFYGSIKYANASVALVCLSTASIFTTLLHTIIHKTKLSLSEITLGLLALIGMYLIYKAQTHFGIGILWGIVAAFLSSVFTIINKQVAEKYPARTLVFYEMSTGLLFISLLLGIYFWYFPNTIFLPQAQHWNSPKWYINDWLWLFVLSFFCTVWGQSLAIAALKKLNSFTVTLSVNMEPIYGIILAIIFFKENLQLNAGFYWGVLLIFLSVALQIMKIVYDHKNKKNLIL